MDSLIEEGGLNSPPMAIQVRLSVALVETRKGSAILMTAQYFLTKEGAHALQRKHMSVQSKTLFMWKRG